MTIQDKAVALRMKKLGILIYDSRLASRRSMEECASAMGISLAEYQSIEDGAASPTLPQLEVLAYFLNVPLEHFWENKSLSENGSATQILDLDTIFDIRQKMIGTAIRQLREQAKVSQAALAAQAEIEMDQLAAYENGDTPVDLVTLEKIASTLNIKIEDFIDPTGPVGLWRTQMKSASKINDLPPDMQEFLLKQINRPYIDLARHLSELSSDKLRSIAEGILEITL
jgi:transcriptional regulator with XRE-family HTH domain